MNKQLFSIAMLGLLSGASVVAMQQKENSNQLPEYLAQYLHVKPSSEYIVRDATPEEVRASQEKVRQEKIAIVKKVAQGEGLKDWQMPDEDTVELYNKTAQITIMQSCKMQ